MDRFIDWCYFQISPLKWGYRRLEKYGKNFILSRVGYTDMWTATYLAPHGRFVKWFGSDFQKLILKVDREAPAAIEFINDLCKAEADRVIEQ